MAHFVKVVKPIVASSAACYFLGISFKEIQELDAGKSSLTHLAVYKNCEKNLQGALKMFHLYQTDLTLEGRVEFWNQYGDLEKKQKELEDRINFATRVYTPAPAPAMPPVTEEKKQ